MLDDDKASAPEEKTIDVQYMNFMVADNPYCIWDVDIEGLTRDFLEGVDPRYFEYVASAHLGEAIDEQSLSASLALRAAYSQALETLFAFIGASLQAPRCAPAWIILYKTPELKDVIGKITSHKPLPSILETRTLSWQHVSEFIHSWLVLDDREKQEQIKTGYAKLWSQFASDFLDDGFAYEYNSIKHGLRIKPGGFHIAIGVQDEPGKPASKEQMKLLGKSEYGSSYYAVEKLLGTAYHLRLRRHRRNWHPEDFAWGLHLISLSMQNVISALQVLNGVPAEEVRFVWPTEEETLKEPWKRAIKIGVKSMSGVQQIIPDELIKPYSRDEIRSRYLDGKHLGIIRYRFKEGPEFEVSDD